jgi:hypothetical protein
MLELGGLIRIYLSLNGLTYYLSDLIEFVFGYYLFDELLILDLLLFVSLIIYYLDDINIFLFGLIYGYYYNYYEALYENIVYN